MRARQRIFEARSVAVTQRRLRETYNPTAGERNAADTPNEVVSWRCASSERMRAQIATKSTVSTGIGAQQMTAMHHRNRERRFAAPSLICWAAAAYLASLEITYLA